MLALCHDKQAADVHQPRPLDSPNGQGLFDTICSQYSEPVPGVNY